MTVEHAFGLAKGARLNQYEVESILGAGGFGITYLAHDTTLDTTVAIKEYMPGELATRLDDSSITPRTSNSKSDFDWGLRRFVDEARVLAKFRHPHIVRVNQIFEAHSTAYLVMEYVKGDTLDAILRRAGALTEEQTKEILFPILDGLKRVHALGFLHRDIKPGNIIVRDEGGAVLIDFGAAREATGSKTRAITSIVTEGYAPLEQYDTTGNQGPWTDIYALGAVAYRCVTGKKPASATSRVRSDPLLPLAVAAPGKVSPAFAAAIESSLRLHEGERPQTIDEFLAIAAGTAQPRSAAPPPTHDATVAMLDATRAMSAPSVNVTPPVTPAPPAISPPSIRPAPSVVPAPVSVKPATAEPLRREVPEPATENRRNAVYLGIAAALLLSVAAGGWFYFQNTGTPAAPGTRVADVSPPPPTTPAPPAPVTPPPAPPPAAAVVPPAPVPATPPTAVPAAPPANSLASNQPPAVAPTPVPPPAPAAPPPPPRNPVPSLPATPAKAIGMLQNFSDPELKATLAQPGLRTRVETLLGLEGCDWRVNGATAGQTAMRQAGAYLNRMNDDALSDTLNDGVLLDRIDVLFGRNRCNVTRQPDSNNGTSGFPDQNDTGRNAGRDAYPRGGFPSGQDPSTPRRGAPAIPNPYGGYGGFNP